MKMGATRREVDTSARLIPLPPSPPANVVRPAEFQRPLLTDTHHLTIGDTLIPMSRFNSQRSTAETLLSVESESCEPSPSREPYLALELEDPAEVQDASEDQNNDPRMRENGMITRPGIARLRVQDEDFKDRGTLKHLRLVRRDSKESQELRQHSRAGTSRTRHNEPPVIVVEDDKTGKVRTQRTTRPERRAASRVRAPTSMGPSFSRQTWSSQYTLDIPHVDIAHRAFMEMGIEVIHAEVDMGPRPRRPPLLPRPQSMICLSGSKGAVTIAITHQVEHVVVFAREFTRLASQSLTAILRSAAGSNRPLFAGRSQTT
ncbi:hypothetical protein OBBRIDRAFT_109420 [Obba rivulosa]|uniref:Uncharacterized protein n=1 Tax=Obba rivulosa TaxID=1052685 RepID=A0A8E2DIE8_9APHY|nr:hypothetical protein OBBRIDRAFT_109420 [Obba rivulosa]